MINEETEALREVAADLRRALMVVASPDWKMERAASYATDEITKADKKLAQIALMPRTDK